MFLTPGDSPMGYRLPLEAMPWTKAEDVTYAFDTDPFRRRDKLPPRPERRMVLFSTPVTDDPPVPAADKGKPKEEDKAALIQTRPALCVQARDGKLYIFMPPVDYLADYLDLVAAIEDTAAHLTMPVVIEGYAPPNDPRISVFKVTPDPGVIEVNIQPAASWDELVENTTAVYELARESRLGTEKFMLDGRHTGTGGGNHLVIGGPTAGGQRISATARSVAQHGRLLAKPSCALLFVLRAVHWPHQPASARGRGADRVAL